MKAMVLDRIGIIGADSAPLRLQEVKIPEPQCGEVRLKIRACGVCHTELDEIEGRTAPPKLPIIPGHEVIGIVDKCGMGVTPSLSGQRVGVGWIHHSCGGELENLSPDFTATGRDADGGYAEYMVIPEQYIFPIPSIFSDAEAAPLLCAGSVGYRSLKLTGLQNGQRLGLTGFGGSAHIVLQLARYLFPATEIYVFARDESARKFASQLGADWVGDTRDAPPHQLHSIIDTTPAWQPVVAALGNLQAGGRLVINAIRKEDNDKNCLNELSYHQHLWLEKEIKSVANITAADIAEFLPLAAAIPIKPEVKIFALEHANEALRELKFDSVRGAKVLVI
ncbi:MAG: zinc-dependent alcohol dehydrogenase family protein [Oceanicoccus sp.]